MIKISLRNIFLGFLSFNFFNENFSPNSHRSHESQKDSTTDNRLTKKDFTPQEKSQYIDYFDDLFSESESDNSSESEYRYIDYFDDLSSESDSEKSPKSEYRSTSSKLKNKKNFSNVSSFKVDSSVGKKNSKEENIFCGKKRIFEEQMSTTIRKEEKKIPTDKMHLLKEMKVDASMEEKIQRIRELLELQISIKKISFIAHIHCTNVTKLAEKWGIKIRKRRNKFEIPEGKTHLFQDMSPTASQEEKEERVKALLELEAPIMQIAFIVHIHSSKIKNLAEKWGIKTRELRNKFKIPEGKTHLFQEIGQKATQKEKEDRIKTLLELGAPVIQIASIVHVDVRKITKLAEKWGIKTREKSDKFKIPEDKTHLFQDMSPTAPQEEKEERVKALLELGAPMRQISSIAYLDNNKIKKLAEKWGIKTRELSHKFKIPEGKAHLFQNIDPTAPQEEKEERIKALLELGVPTTQIASIVYIHNSKIKKLAEKCGIKIRERCDKFKIPEGKTHLFQEMRRIAPQKEKKERIKALLELGVPVTQIFPIVHVNSSKIKKLAEKWGIKTRESNNKFKIPEGKTHLFQEMRRIAPQKEKEERIKALLELGVPVTQIFPIVHVDSRKIKKLAEKWGIKTREGRNKVKLSENKDYLFHEMSKYSAEEEKEYSSEEENSQEEKKEK